MLVVMLRRDAVMPMMVMMIMRMTSIGWQLIVHG
jgi:hypothetical protein